MVPVLIPWMLRDRWILFALLTCSVLGTGLLMTTFALEHYAAPIAGLMFVFALQAMRLWLWRDKLVGNFVVWLVLFLCVYALVQSLYRAKQDALTARYHRQRAHILKQLAKHEGRHLIIVSYGPNHNIHREWVYNKADIDSAKLVWARDMDEAKNRELVNYFNDRHVWWLEADSTDSIPKLRPYSAKLL
jgi:hypothetical protein